MNNYNEIYEVSRDEYVGFLNQIKPDARFNETIEDENYFFIKVYSKNNGTHFCTRIMPKTTDEEGHYYIFNMPADNERCEPIAIQKIKLETREEVQNFFDILSKIQKGEIDD